MPQVADRIFISIGVSKPEGGLEELPGAINAAERMAAWARAQGYMTLLIHDGNHPEVTVDLLRTKITEAISQVTDQVELKRLVVFFAGHGAAQAVADQYWILTNWQKRSTEAIKVSSLQRVLEYYGPRQVAIIGDACQEVSASFLDLLGSAILDRPNEDPRKYELDRFFAAGAGKQAFMIKGEDGQEDFCLFTELLLDALEGDVDPPAYELRGQDRVVTSQSLASYLDSNLQREASKFDLRMIPDTVSGFRTDTVYLELPPPAAGQSPVSDQIGVRSTDSARDLGTGGGWSVPDATPVRAVPRVPLALPDVSGPGPEAQARSLAHAREEQRRAFNVEVHGSPVRTSFETGCGICVSGAKVASVEAASAWVSIASDEHGWFRIQLKDDTRLASSDTLVTLADGRVFAVCAVHGFIAALHVLEDGAPSLLHLRLPAELIDERHAIDLLAGMHAGTLTPEEIISAAATLRDGKHGTLTLGCIAAQFYDAIRDTDSLRSMASFYAAHGQPVPLDIVLYGGGRIGESEGRLVADIPAVSAREPRTDAEQARAFSFHATPAVHGHPIAGRIPWMREAWGAIATASCDPSAEPWRQQALAALPHLGPGVFTNTPQVGREALARLARLPDLAAEPLAAAGNTPD